jgi:hypothetical protein
MIITVYLLKIFNKLLIFQEKTIKLWLKVIANEGYERIRIRVYIEML